MKLLLDTHIWLWTLGVPGQLRPRVQAVIERSTNELWLSPLSVWEVLLLAGKGRISLIPTAQEWLAVALTKVPAKEAPLTAEVVLATRQIDLTHRDPVDLFLAATTRVFDLTLVTADKEHRGEPIANLRP